MHLTAHSSDMAALSDWRTVIYIHPVVDVIIREGFIIKNTTPLSRKQAKILSYSHCHCQQRVLFLFLRYYPHLQQANVNRMLSKYT